MHVGTYLLYEQNHKHCLTLNFIQIKNIIVYDGISFTSLDSI